MLDIVTVAQLGAQLLEARKHLEAAELRHNARIDELGAEIETLRGLASLPHQTVITHMGARVNAPADVPAVATPSADAPADVPAVDAPADVPADAFADVLRGVMPVSDRAQLLAETIAGPLSLAMAHMFRARTAKAAAPLPQSPSDRQQSSVLSEESAKLLAAFEAAREDPTVFALADVAVRDIITHDYPEDFPVLCGAYPKKPLDLGIDIRQSLHAALRGFDFAKYNMVVGGGGTLLSLFAGVTSPYIELCFFKAADEKSMWAAIDTLCEHIQAVRAQPVCKPCVIRMGTESMNVLHDNEYIVNVCFENYTDLRTLLRRHLVVWDGTAVQLSAYAKRVMETQCAVIPMSSAGFIGLCSTLGRNFDVIAPNLDITKLKAQAGKATASMRLRGVSVPVKMCCGGMLHYIAKEAKFDDLYCRQPLPSTHAVNSVIELMENEYRKRTHFEKNYFVEFAHQRGECLAGAVTAPPSVIEVAEVLYAMIMQNPLDVARCHQIFGEKFLPLLGQRLAGVEVFAGAGSDGVFGRAFGGIFAGARSVEVFAGVDRDKVFAMIVEAIAPFVIGLGDSMLRPRFSTDEPPFVASRPVLASWYGECYRDI